MAFGQLRYFASEVGGVAPVARYHSLTVSGQHERA